MRIWHKTITFIGVFALLQACSVKYSLGNPGSIPPEAKTFTIPLFVDGGVGPGYLTQNMTNALRSVIISQSRLAQQNEGGDLVFEGKVTQYVTDVAGLQGTTTTTASNTSDLAAQAVLTIKVKVKYTNPYDETKNFDQEFSDKEFYPREAILSNVENELITRIVDKIAQAIFDRAFGDW
jgi:hypothetical protein